MGTDGADHGSTLLFISSLPPSDRDASMLVIRRHLTRLEADGYTISAAYRRRCADQVDCSLGWEGIELPDRRPWWPPVRPNLPVTTSIRIRSWSSLLLRTVRRSPPAAVFAHLWGVGYPDVAEVVASRLNLPLLVFAHDDCRHWASGPASRLLERTIRAVIARADRVYAVSERLATTLPPARPGALKILPPMPADAIYDCVGDRRSWNDPPTLAYAGNFYPGLELTLVPAANALAEIGWRLLVVCDESAFRSCTRLASAGNVIHHGRFPESGQVRRYLRENASAILVAHPPNRPALTASFPSKLVDFVHLGLPTLIVAPTDGAVGEWAMSRRWTGFADVADEAAVASVVRSLGDHRACERMAGEAKAAAAGEFNPDVIHACILNDLQELGVHPSPSLSPRPPIALNRAGAK